MKKLTIPIIVIIGFLALVYAVLRLKYHTTEICLFGAGYAALLMAIYALIPAINNPNYSVWWSIPDNATPAQRWGLGIGNFVTCMAVCWSTFELPKESLSDLNIKFYILLALIVATIGVLVRRLMVKSTTK